MNDEQTAVQAAFASALSELSDDELHELIMESFTATPACFVLEQTGTRCRSCGEPEPPTSHDTNCHTIHPTPF